jgi:hypothetical protein
MGAKTMPVRRRRGRNQEVARTLAYPVRMPIETAVAGVTGKMFYLRAEISTVARRELRLQLPADTERPAIAGSSNSFMVYHAGFFEPW